jgi:hypothetical protein
MIQKENEMKKTNKQKLLVSQMKERMSFKMLDRERENWLSTNTRNPARRFPLILGNAVINKDGRFRIQNRVEIVRDFLPVSPLL